MKTLKVLSILLISILLIALNVSAQQMHVKRFNLTTLNTDKKVSSELLAKKSSPQARQHPEYGVLPYNAQCSECVELIDKRTLDSRLFIDPKNERHTYSQQSYFPLHYKKSDNDIWRTIDSRLRLRSPGVYTADKQPVPTKCDLNRKLTSLTEKGFEFEFNKNLSLYFFDDNTVYTQKIQGNYSNYSIGEEGLSVKNIWPGIEMEQLFTAGQVKSNFIISAPLQLPVATGWMVIEDHFTLPDNISIAEDEHGSHLPGGYYRGDYLLKNEKGETLITYEKPVYIDANVFGMHGVYNLIRSGNDYTLQTMVPVEWLKKTDNAYPLMIDPTVFGATKMGDFTHTGLPAANFAFTSMQLGSCEYHMQVTVPGASTLTNAFVDLEYSMTYDNTCGAPPLPPPYCTFSQVSMEVLCDTCHTTSGFLSCHPATPPYTGTCTTDSNIVVGANAVLINNPTPNFISCLSPQCQNYNLGFTLRNRDSICGDQCGYLCARGNMWRMTIEGERTDAIITQTDSEICGGNAVTFTVNASGGVPPYSYAWTADGGTSFDTITGTHDFTIHPQSDVVTTCYVLDGCGGLYGPSASNDLNVHVNPHVSVTVSLDTFTSSVAQHYQWYLNGNMLASDTLQQYIAHQPGQYQVQVTDTGGCTGLSSTVYYLVSGIKAIDAGGGKMTVVPNPSDGNFVLSFTGLTNSAPFTLRIFDVSGKLIEARELQADANGAGYNFKPQTQMSTGVYFLQAEFADAIYREKLLINE